MNPFERDLERFRFAAYNEEPIRFRKKEWNEDRAKCLTTCFCLLSNRLTKSNQINNFIYEQQIEIVNKSGDIINKYSLSIDLL